MDISTRFWSKVNIAGEGDCWLWQAGTTGGGYGVFGTNGKGVSAHRVAYELVRGEIPQGLHIDHLCRNILCVNPSHLEAVTPRENNVRRTQAMQTCRSGKHPFTDIYITPAGHRTCRECRREQDRIRQTRRTEAVRQRKAERTICANGHPWANLYVSPRGYATCRVCNRERVRQHARLTSQVP